MTNLTDLPNEMKYTILNNIMCDNEYELFNRVINYKYLSKEFNKLSCELIANKQLKPEPKFRRGQLVKFNKSEEERIRKNVQELQKTYGHSVGEQPYGRLILYCDPVWIESLKTYRYDYEYGIFGDHEGATYEHNLELFPTLRYYGTNW